MKIKILVKTNSKNDLVEKISPDEFVVRLKAPAREGKANKKLTKVLADYYSIPQSGVVIKSGLRFKHKIVEILVK